MFENRTAEIILNEMLNSIPDNVNKTEGSLIYSTLAAQAEKLEKVYLELDSIIDNAAPDTCDRESLLRYASARGLHPKSATYAVYRGVFNCEMKIGDRFSLNEYTFIIIDKISENNYKLKAEQPGAAVNNCFGNLSFLGYNENFRSGVLTELITPAVDSQETESFRQEYFESVEKPTFAGNIPAYIKSVEDIEGVGLCKVYSADSGPGTVKLVITSNTNGVPSDELIQHVQDIVDPSTDINNYGRSYGLPLQDDYKGKGYGLAPINQSVIVAAVKPTLVNFEIELKYESGYSADVLRDKINLIIDNYFENLKLSWRTESNIVIRKAYIEIQLLSTPGIQEVTSLNINGTENLKLDSDSIPVKGSVSIG